MLSSLQGNRGWILWTKKKQEDKLREMSGNFEGNGLSKIETNLKKE